MAASRTDTRSSGQLDPPSSIPASESDESSAERAARGADRPLSLRTSESERLEAQDWEREQQLLRNRMAEARLPYFDQLLIEKYVLRPRPGVSRDDQREMCHALLEVLMRHHAATVDVLRAIEAREETVRALSGLAEEARHASEAGEAGARSAVKVDLQAQALRQLYTYRQRTLVVVEAITTWRANLNRPFAFMHQGTNYVLKICTDSARIERSTLGSLLPLQLTEHPLLSNVPALNLFGGSAAGPSSASSTPRQRDLAQRQFDRATVPPLSAAQQRKLAAAEGYIRGELDAQLSLHRDLLHSCSVGCFVPVLNVPRVIPCGPEGIRMLSTEWLDKLKGSLLAALQQMLHLPDGLVAEGDEDEGVSDDEGHETAEAAQDRTQAAVTA